VHKLEIASFAGCSGEGSGGAAGASAPPTAATTMEPPYDVNPLGFVPDLSMRGVGDNSIGRDDVHGPTTTFQRMRLSNQYTTSYGCRNLVERVTRPLGHLFLQAIEEQARTSNTSK
jgi:hypothetical protein